MGFSYFLFNKPYGVLSQFSRNLPSQLCLSDLLKLAKDIYPVGRLDADSEGLLLLTNDPDINSRLLNPDAKVEKAYRCQIEGDADQQTLDKLLYGILLRINKKEHWAKALRISIIDSSFQPPMRNPAIRYRKNIPTSWIEIVINEGKNRQVRRMLAGIGYPVLRLIRWSIGDINIFKLEMGQLKPITKRELINLALKQNN